MSTCLKHTRARASCRLNVCLYTMSETRGAVCLWGEERVGIPADVWEQLITEVQCPTLEWIHDASVYDTRDMGVWSNVPRNRIRDVLLANYDGPFVDQVGNELSDEELPCPPCLEHYLCYDTPTKIHSTIIVFRTEEWAQTYKWCIWDACVNPRVYQYLGVSGLVRRRDLEKRRYSITDNGYVDPDSGRVYGKESDEESC